MCVFIFSTFKSLLSAEDISCTVNVNIGTGTVPAEGNNATMNTITVKGRFLIMDRVTSPRFTLSISPGKASWRLSIPKGNFQHAWNGQADTCNLFKLMPYVGSILGFIDLGFSQIHLNVPLRENAPLKGEMVLFKERLQILDGPCDLKLDQIRAVVHYNSGEDTWEKRIQGTRLCFQLRVFGIVTVEIDQEFPPTGTFLLLRWRVCCYLFAFLL